MRNVPSYKFTGSCLIFIESNVKRASFPLRKATPSSDVLSHDMVGPYELITERELYMQVIAHNKTGNEIIEVEL